MADIARKPLNDASIRPAKRRVAFNVKNYRSRPLRLREAPVYAYVDLEDEWMTDDRLVDSQVLDPGFDDLDCDPAELLGMRFRHDD